MKPIQAFKALIKYRFDNCLYDDERESTELKAVISEISPNQFACFILNFYEGDLDENESNEIFNIVKKRIKDHLNTDTIKLFPIFYVGNF